MVLPQTMMTEWYWSPRYRRLHVCKQFLDDHTQQETQYVAQLIDLQAYEKFPVSWEALKQQQ